jgi:hypothetical protein
LGVSDRCECLSVRLSGEHRFRHLLHHRLLQFVLLSPETKLWQCLLCLIFNLYCRPSKNCTDLSVMLRILQCCSHRYYLMTILFNAEDILDCSRCAPPPNIVLPMTRPKNTSENWPVFIEVCRNVISRAGIATGYRVYDRMIGVRLPAGAGNFSL